MFSPWFATVLMAVSLLLACGQDVKIIGFDQAYKNLPADASDDASADASADPSSDVSADAASAPSGF